MAGMMAIGDGLPLFCGSGSFETFRPIVQPNAVFVLKGDQRRDGGS
jgi:hypothetical protein